MFRHVRLGLLLAPLLLSLALPASSVAVPPGCDGPVYDDPQMGRVCPSAGGYTVFASDGTALFTHGGDPIPASPMASSALPDPGVECVTAEDPHLRILYAWPSDTNLLVRAYGEATRRPLAVPAVLNANAILHANAALHGVEMRLKTLCDEDGLPLVEEVTLPLTAANFNFWDMANVLNARGYGGANEKVLVFYDGTWNWCGCGGWAYIPGDDSWGPSNWNNYGYWSYAGIFLGNYFPSAIGAIDEVVLHEVTHMMGGVQMSAPNSSGGWHCNDGWDIMCYGDGGSTSSYSTYCHPYGFTWAGATQPYDCGNDDYFHPKPWPGSYLDTHWNVGADYNRFLARG